MIGLRTEALVTVFGQSALFRLLLSSPAATWKVEVNDALPSTLYLVSREK